MPSTVNRRAFRFSLPALFAVVTVCAVLFAWLRAPLDQMRLEADVTKRIEQLGGRITWGGSLEGKGRHGRSYIGAIDLSGTKVTDNDLAAIGKLKELTHLSLNDTRITDAGVAQLAGPRRLKQLELSGTKISDAGARRLPQISRYLGETAVTDEAISLFNDANHRALR